jgi:hypothetical protein
MARRVIAIVLMSPWCQTAANHLRGSVALIFAVVALQGCFFTSDRSQRNDQLYHDAVVQTLNPGGHQPYLYILPSSQVRISDTTVIIDCATTAHPPTGPIYWVTEEQPDKAFLARAGQAPVAIVLIDIDTHGCFVGEAGNFRRLKLMHLVSSNLGKRIMRRLHYVYTVPLDIVTSPMQFLDGFPTH